MHTPETHHRSNFSHERGQDRGGERKSGFTWILAPDGFVLMRTLEAEAVQKSTTRRQCLRRAWNVRKIDSRTMAPDGMSRVNFWVEAGDLRQQVGPTSAESYFYRWHVDPFHFVWRMNASIPPSHWRPIHNFPWCCQVIFSWLAVH